MSRCGRWPCCDTIEAQRDRGGRARSCARTTTWQKQGDQPPTKKKKLPPKQRKEGKRPRSQTESARPKGVHLPPGVTRAERTRHSADCIAFLFGASPEPAVRAPKKRTNKRKKRRKRQRFKNATPPGRGTVGGQKRTKGSRRKETRPRMLSPFTLDPREFFTLLPIGFIHPHLRTTEYVRPFPVLPAASSTGLYTSPPSPSFFVFSLTTSGQAGGGVTHNNTLILTSFALGGATSTSSTLSGLPASQAMAARQVIGLPVVSS